MLSVRLHSPVNRATFGRVDFHRSPEASEQTVDENACSFALLISSQLVGVANAACLLRPFQNSARNCRYTSKGTRGPCSKMKAASCAFLPAKCGRILEITEIARVPLASASWRPRRVVNALTPISFAAFSIGSSSKIPIRTLASKYLFPFLGLLE
jgi:hypothetical protein